MSSMSDIRQRIIEIAERSIGKVGPELAPLCGLVGSPWERELYRPFKTNNGVTLGVSTCGLVAEGIWHEAGVAIPSTWRPYHPERAQERAISRGVQFARASQAIRTFDGSNAPQPGDYIVIGEGFREHALTMIASFDDDNLPRIESVDGGQVSERNGLQTIKRRTRAVTKANGALWLDDRKVQLWIDVEALPLVW